MSISHTRLSMHENCRTNVALLFIQNQETNMALMLNPFHESDYINFAIEYKYLDAVYTDPDLRHEFRSFVAAIGAVDSKLFDLLHTIERSLEFEGIYHRSAHIRPQRLFSFRVNVRTHTDELPLDHFTDESITKTKIAMTELFKMFGIKAIVF